MNPALATPLSHAEQEAAAYNAWWAAVQRGDHSEQHRLWRVYSDVHSKRPVEVVRAMEEAKGLR